MQKLCEYLYLTSISWQQQTMYSCQSFINRISHIKRKMRHEIQVADEKGSLYKIILNKHIKLNQTLDMILLEKFINI